MTYIESHRYHAVLEELSRLTGYREGVKRCDNWTDEATMNFLVSLKTFRVLTTEEFGEFLFRKVSGSVTDRYWGSKIAAKLDTQIAVVVQELYDCIIVEESEGTQ